MRLALAAALLASLPASARVPDAADVLARTAAWARELPAVAVEYGLHLTEDGRERQGTLTLTARRAVECTETALLQSPALTLWGALLRGEGAAALSAAGVDASTVALYHLHRRVVVILGARPMDGARPQVWFDRDTGAPVRLLLGSEDVMLFDHDFPGTQGRFPGTLRWRAGAARADGVFRRTNP